MDLARSQVEEKMFGLNRVRHYPRSSWWRECVVCRDKYKELPKEIVHCPKCGGRLESKWYILIRVLMERTKTLGTVIWVIWLYIGVLGGLSLIKWFFTGHWLESPE